MGQFSKFTRQSGTRSVFPTLVVLGLELIAGVVLACACWGAIDAPGGASSPSGWMAPAMPLARIFHSLRHRYDYFSARVTSAGGGRRICGLSPDAPTCRLGPRVVNGLHAGYRIQCETSGLVPLTIIFFLNLLP